MWKCNWSIRGGYAFAEEPFNPLDVRGAQFEPPGSLQHPFHISAGGGVPPEVVRPLILETARGAAEMGLARPDQKLSALLDSLATPGGITRAGLKTLEDRQSLDAWTDAMDVVLKRLRGAS